MDRTFHRQNISWTWTFIRQKISWTWTFIRQNISWTGHFIDRTFHGQDISWTGHLLEIFFHKLSFLIYYAIQILRRKYIYFSLSMHFLIIEMSYICVMSDISNVYSIILQVHPNRKCPS